MESKCRLTRASRISRFTRKCKRKNALEHRRKFTFGGFDINKECGKRMAERNDDEYKKLLEEDS